MIIFDMVIRIVGFNNILRNTFGLSRIDLCLKPDIPYQSSSLHGSHTCLPKRSEIKKAHRNMPRNFVAFQNQTIPVHT